MARLTWVLAVVGLRTIVIAQGLAVTTTVRAEIYGSPGPVVGQAREANTAAGIPFTTKPDALGGFSRG
jgi:hypothetical protein